MCQDQFMNKEPIEVWQFLEDLAENRLQWEIIRKFERLSPSRGGVHQVQSFLAEEAKFASLIHRIEALELKGCTPVNQVNQVSAHICNGCGDSNHVMKGIPTS